MVANGCVNQSAFVSLGLDAGDAVYLSPRGVHSLRQSRQHGAQQDTFLSWKIRRTFASLNKSRLQYAQGAYWSEQGMVVFLVSGASAGSHDTLLALDIKNVQDLNAKTAHWFIWKPQGFTPTVLLSARDTGDAEHLYLGTNDGRLLQMSLNVFTDLGTFYDDRFRTRYFDFGKLGTTLAAGDIFVIAQPAGLSAASLQLIYDWGATAQPTMEIPKATQASFFGSAQFGTDLFGQVDSTRLTHLYGDGEGASVALEFSDDSGEDFRLAGGALQVRQVGEDLSSQET